MVPPQTIIYLCLVAGLSMVAGWWVAFRNRPYLGLLGVAFITLSGYVAAGNALRQARQAHLPTDVLSWVTVAAMVITIAFFLAAVWAAVQESRRRLQEVRDHFRAAEEALTAMMEVERRKKEQQDKDGE